MKKQKFWIVEELFKQKETDQTGWVFEFELKLSQQQLRDIGYELHQQLLVEFMIVGKDNRLVALNSTPLKDDECLKRIQKIIEEEYDLIENQLKNVLN